MTGKLDRETLERLVLSRTGAPNSAVAVGPSYGEDAAAVETTGTLVASTDPVSLAGERVGRIAVAVATNDVAASGGDPAFLLVTLLLPDADVDLLDRITADVDATAVDLGASVVGGHTEVVAGLDRPIVSTTCLGTADRFVPTGGAEHGDAVLLAGSAGIEATAVVAADFGDEFDLDPALVERATRRFDELSVRPAATALTPLATAMHDPTEGGVLGAAVEMAVASDRSLRLDREAVPVADDTRRVCAAAGLDPLRSLGSGALLATCRPDRLEAARDALADAGVPAAEIGVVEAGDDPGVSLDGDRVSTPVRDDVYDLW